MYQNIKEFVEAILMPSLTFLFMGILIFFLAIFGKYFLEKKNCLSSYSNYEPQYGFWTECRVMWNGKLTPTDIVRLIK